MLSWRVDYLSGLSIKAFDGPGDVRMFFFYFENVSLGRKEDENKTLELLGNQDGIALQFIYDNFTLNRVLLQEAEDFETVKKR